MSTFFSEATEFQPSAKAIALFGLIEGALKMTLSIIDLSLAQFKNHLTSEIISLKYLFVFA